MFSQLAEHPPLRRVDLEGRKQAEVEIVRARAHWDARRRFWFDVMRDVEDVRALRTQRVGPAKIEPLRKVTR